MNKLRCKYLLSVVGLAGVFSIVGTGAAQAESLQTSSQLIQSSTSASEPVPASELSADRLEASALQTETLTAQAVDITPDES
ncbi:hypothetical protein [Leptolyngbya ohadii]|uniref:hypothetical protein n=1 Tax=Leptolyngbya ohadii TaxID=1962290 RepID=UPI000B59EB0C|nr:hypothetical protein [Leptolyngbya ohadii]